MASTIPSIIPKVWRILESRKLWVNTEAMLEVLPQLARHQSYFPYCHLPFLFIRSLLYNHHPTTFTKLTHYPLILNSTIASSKRSCNFTSSLLSKSRPLNLIMHHLQPFAVPHCFRYSIEQQTVW